MSGIDSPATFNLVNISSITPFQTLYSQRGSIVSMSGTVQVTVTSATTLSGFDFNPPVVSAFTLVEDASLTINSLSTFGTGEAIVSGSRIRFRFISSVTAGETITLKFTGQYIEK